MQTMTDFAGDSAIYKITVKNKGVVQDITDWKIAAEFWDLKHTLKKATANIGGGSDDQIRITAPLLGQFEIYVAKGETIDFEPESFLEIVNYTSNQKDTLIRCNIAFQEPKITWESE